jgi:YidC/Oxa1 family membrane protein insertase
MEQPRFILAIALSFCVFLIWNYFFVDNTQVKKTEEKTEVQQAVKTETPVTESATKAPEKTVYQVTSAIQNTVPRVIKVKTPYYSVDINAKGAAVTSFMLSQYKETTDDNSPNKELIAKELEKGTVTTGFAGQSVPGLENAIFTSDVKDELIEINEGGKEVLFYWKSAQGVVIEKKYFFSADTYMVGLDINVINGSGEPIKDSLTVSLNSYYPDTNSAVGFLGPSALLNNSLEQINLDDIEGKGVHTGLLKWISVQDRYFMSSLIPKTPVETNMRLLLKDKRLLEAQYVNPPKEIHPGAQEQVKFNLFFGPKSLKLLKSIGYDLNLAINFGWFDFIAKPFLYFMNFLYGFIPNYGVAIILLTIATKIIFWPLGTKSYKSMNEMKKIQPLLAEIKEKYGNDKKRMNEEVMSLYKTYKINPLGGCLPMVAQIPVFFALYRMLYEAIELRHAPFLLWIKDLSAPDRLFHFSFSIPFMEPPYGIPVLTIIMGATMFIQQKMTPAVGDPMQQKMMMILPVVFTVIFVNFSAGLVLYWLINNVLSIIQQYNISRKAA